MPEATDDEGNEDVEIVADGGATAAAQGDVNIVLQPVEQGNVPAAPKVGHTRGKERTTEVLGQVNAQYPGHTHGHERIAGKIGVDLYRKQDDCHQAGHTCKVHIVGEDHVHIDGDAVGDNHLHEQAPQQHPHPLDSLGVIEIRAHALQLWNNKRRLVNRARRDAREERDKQGIGEEITLHLLTLVIHVPQVAQGL